MKLGHYLLSPRWAGGRPLDRRNERGWPVAAPLTAGTMGVPHPSVLRVRSLTLLSRRVLDHPPESIRINPSSPFA